MDAAQKIDLANEAAKAAPPLVVVGSDLLMGHGIPYWVGLATMIYITLQAAFLLWKWWRMAQDRKALDDADD